METCAVEEERKKGGGERRGRGRGLERKREGGGGAPEPVGEEEKDGEGGEEGEKERRGWKGVGGRVRRGLGGGSPISGYFAEGSGSRWASGCTLGSGG